MYQRYEIEQLFHITHFINLSYYALPGTYESLGESHEFWECVYVDQGEVLIRADDVTYNLRAGELAFHSPNEYHNIIMKDSKPAGILVMAFTCSSPMMEKFRHKILLLGQQEKACLRTITQEASETYSFFENKAPRVDLRKSDHCNIGSEQIIQTAIEQMFIYILRHDDNVRFEERGYLTQPRHNNEKLVNDIKAYLQEHLTEKITLEQISARFHISCAQLKRIFKDYTNTTIIAYLISLRINKAKKLIRETNMSFYQVADLSGYDNICYFSTQFKKYTGMTPTEYARSVRQ